MSLHLRSTDQVEIRAMRRLYDILRRESIQDVVSVFVAFKIGAFDESLIVADTGLLPQLAPIGKL
jgi:hypothetical protein